jgi:hypothetical protein
MAATGALALVAVTLNFPEAPHEVAMTRPHATIRHAENNAAPGASPKFGLPAIVTAACLNSPGRGATRPPSEWAISCIP